MIPYKIFTNFYNYKHTMLKSPMSQTFSITIKVKQNHFIDIAILQNIAKASEYFNKLVKL